MKFKYNWVNNLLYQVENKQTLIQPANYTNDWRAKWFILAPGNWISFQVYPQLVKAFYKQTKEGKVSYYQKLVAIIPLNQLPLIIPQSHREVRLEFTAEDLVEKVDGKWIKKGGNHER